MDIDRIYQLMGSAVKRVYGFYIKRPLQRFNVDNRAEKLIEKQKTIPKVAPRHERTDQLFKQITQINPRLREELNEKREDLLKRLDSVKVVSKERVLSEEELTEMEEIKQKVRNRLPHSRDGTYYPIHAYIEPNFVPKGRISLIRAIDFIGKHYKDPIGFDSETIAKQHHLKTEDVDNILNHFRPFYTDQLTGKGEKEENIDKVFGLAKYKFSELTQFLKPKPKVIGEQIEGSSDKTSNDRKENIENKDKDNKEMK